MGGGEKWWQEHFVIHYTHVHWPTIINLANMQDLCKIVEDIKSANIPNNSNVNLNWKLTELTMLTNRSSFPSLKVKQISLEVFKVHVNSITQETSSIRCSEK